MFALIIPVLLPCILLGVVMGLSWWEDRLLLPAVSALAVADAPQLTAISVASPEVGLLDAA